MNNNTHSRVGDLITLQPRPDFNNKYPTFWRCCDETGQLIVETTEVILPHQIRSMLLIERVTKTGSPAFKVLLSRTDGSMQMLYFFVG